MSRTMSSRYPFYVAALLLCAFIFSATAEERSQTLLPAPIITDSSSAPIPADTAAVKDTAGLTSAKTDTMAVISPTGNVKRIVKRDFNAREQVVVGSIIMTFIIIIIITVGNWNP